MKKRTHSVEVELIQHHRHGPLILRPDDRITVSAPVRDFLVARGIAREVPARPAGAGAAAIDDEAEAGAEAPATRPDEPSTLEE